MVARLEKKSGERERQQKNQRGLKRMSRENGVRDLSLSSLPEGCIANILSLTSTRDVCRLSLVASTFLSAAESDAVWERFLPEDYQELIGRSVDSSSSWPIAFRTKKELYLHLCDHPILIDGGFKSFSLEKWSGKKCYMLAARDLTIVWGDTPEYWRWISLSESRFTEVAELLDVCWLEIRGKINTSMLSPNTRYAAYLVFKFKTGTYGFEDLPVDGLVGISGEEGEKRDIYLDSKGGHRLQRKINIPRRTGLFNRRRSSMSSQQVVSSPEGQNGQYQKSRGDGWLEIELGEYGNCGGDGELEMSLMGMKRGHWKRGLIVQGIEIRPKE